MIQAKDRSKVGGRKEWRKEATRMKKGAEVSERIGKGREERERGTEGGKEKREERWVGWKRQKKGSGWNEGEGRTGAKSKRRSESGGKVD